MDLPASLWPALFRSISSAPWLGASKDEASAFVRACIRHRLLSLLLEESSLPDPIRAALPLTRAVQLVQIERTQLQLRALARLASVLEDEPYVLLKGCDYAFRLYPRPELRPMADIDFLIPRERIEAVAERLRAAGARQEFPAGPASRLRSYGEMTFVLDEVTIEPHHAFTQRARNSINYNEIWRDRVPFSAGAIRAFRLSDEDAILHAAISMASEYFDLPMIRYLDLYLLLDGSGVDLADLARRAREWRIRRPLFSALHQTSVVFPELRPKVEPMLHCLLSERERRFLIGRLLPPPLSYTKATRRDQLWRKFHLIDGYSARLSFLLYHSYAAVAGRALAIVRPHDGRDDVGRRS